MSIWILYYIRVVATLPISSKKQVEEVVITRGGPTCMHKSLQVQCIDVIAVTWWCPGQMHWTCSDSCMHVLVITMKIHSIVSILRDGKTISVTLITLHGQHHMSSRVYTPWLKVTRYITYTYTCTCIESNSFRRWPCRLENQSVLVFQINHRANAIPAHKIHDYRHKLKHL